jgi:CHAD domain-containing protein
MKKKKETKYLDKEWKVMNMHLKAFLETGDQEELHKFRVQIKKLGAMLRLFESTSKHNRLLKDFKPVKKIFKYAGHIRDAYTNLQLGLHYEFKNEAFETGQQTIIENGTREFQHQGKKYLKNIKETYKQVKKQLTRVDDSLIAEYYKKRLEEIAVNLTVSGFNEDMHTNRKLIKILVYNHKLADKALNGSLSFNSDYLDQLQNSIGKWHDNVLAAQLFSSPELNDKPVVTLIKRKNAGIKRSISVLADDFWNKATTVEMAVSNS